MIKLIHRNINKKIKLIDDSVYIQMRFCDPIEI